MPAAHPTGPSAPTAVHSAVIECEVCGGETEHRILKFDRRGAGRPAGEIRGLARCRICRTTHSFRSSAPAEVEVRTVVSQGRTSETGTLRLPRGTLLESGRFLPGERDPPLRLMRIDRTDGTRARTAPAELARTLWLTPHLGEAVRISVIEGEITRSITQLFPSSATFSVGASIHVEGRALRVVGLRARGQTWKVPGDTFSAAEVDRVYARRTVSPPAGRRAWIRDRASPSSRASSISRSARSRSAPGARTNRG